MIQVLFFAQLREVLQTEGLALPKSSSTVAELRIELQQKGPLWQEYLSNSRSLVAVNQTMQNDQAKLSDGDEVAFFPPVTGG
jgi:molybdopterin synthase sulfur carrier subunit